MGPSVFNNPDTLSLHFVLGTIKYSTVQYSAVQCTMEGNIWYMQYCAVQYRSVKYAVLYRDFFYLCIIFHSFYSLKVNIDKSNVGPLVEFFDGFGYQN